MGFLENEPSLSKSVDFKWVHWQYRKALDKLLLYKLRITWKRLHDCFLRCDCCGSDASLHGFGLYFTVKGTSWRVERHHTVWNQLSVTKLWHRDRLAPLVSRHEPPDMHRKSLNFNWKARSRARESGLAKETKQILLKRDGLVELIVSLWLLY